MSPRHLRLIPALLALLAGAAVAATPVLPFSEVSAGQKGTGRTVFAGEEVSEFEVEILGKLERIAPGRDIILARLSGGPLERTGVLAGMSGSPVYIEGRLVGAVAFTWGFGKEPIAGITPIEEMRADASLSLRGTRLDSAGPGLGPLSAELAFLDPLPVARRLRLGRATAPPGDALSPGRLLVSAAGLSAGARASLAEMLPGDSLLLPGGASARAVSTGSEGASEGLAPGDAVGVRLVDGDLDMTAVGTVTDVEGTRVLAFGHPLLGLGEVRLPMTRARIQTLFPSLSQSFKVASSGAEVGAFLSDLASGASGRLGAEPSMVPVRVELPRRDGEASSTFTFRVASDPLLTPPLLFLTLSSLTEEVEPGPGATSFRFREGSTLLLEDGRQVDLSFFYSGDGAGELMAALVAIISQALLQNEYEPTALEGVNLLLEHAPERLEASLIDLVPERRRVRAGETLRVSAVLQVYRGERRVEAVELQIPSDLGPGPVTIIAGDALRLAVRESDAGASLRPRNLDELIRIVNNLRSFDRLYVVGLRREATAVLGAEPLPHLPPSRALALVGSDEQGSATLIRERSIFEQAIPLGLTPRGFRRVTVEVLPALASP